MDTLKGKTIIITGGLGLLGQYFSKSCAHQDANVIVVDIDLKKGQKFEKTLKAETENNNIFYFDCDITKDKDIESLLDEVIPTFSRIDGLINSAYPRNAHYGRIFEDVEYDDFIENVNMHLGGYFNFSKFIAKNMELHGGGSIINMASIYGFRAPRFEVYYGTNMTMPIEYAAIKGAIINLTTYLASYLGKYNIRVNAISPGGIFNNQPDSFVKQYSSRVVLGNHMLDPSDVAGVALFLLSDNSKYMTGQNIVIDGGWSL
jgi:NAD(P)-dependent dehydrogenase (short-subunit alcohol dehydrogenase family)